MKIISYLEKTVYIGIDVHKATYSVTCICDKSIAKKATVKADPVALAEGLGRWFKGAEIRSVYEAGFSAFVLHRALVKEGIHSLVVNPASIAVAANDKVKTDKRDSKKLALELADGRIKGIYVPTEAEELARLLPRTRTQVVEHRATVARQIKMKLHQFGFIGSDSRRMISSRYLRDLEKQAMPAELKTSLSFLFAQWRFATAQLLDLRRKLRLQAKIQPALDTVYQSVPGIGLIVARTLATELGDMSRFANERSLYSYTGLTPSERSSGEAVRRGHISRQGSSRLRWLLVETAWRAITKDEALRAIFERIAKTRGKKRAIVAVARRLIGRIRACFRNGTIYAVGTYA